MNEINNPQIDIEYEGQSYSIDRAKIEGLSDEQIISMLSVGFPGMAGAKLERKDDSIKIIKRVGTKGSYRTFLAEIEACRVDSLRQEISDLNHQLNQSLSLAQWEKIEAKELEGSVEQTYRDRQQIIASSLTRLSSCKTHYIPLF